MAHSIHAIHARSFTSGSPLHMGNNRQEKFIHWLETKINKGLVEIFTN